MDVEPGDDPRRAPVGVPAAESRDGGGGSIESSRTERLRLGRLALVLGACLTAPIDARMRWREDGLSGLTVSLAGSVVGFGLLYLAVSWVISWSSRRDMTRGVAGEGRGEDT